jgi:hypothetical protein
MVGERRRGSEKRLRRVTIKGSVDLIDQAFSLQVREGDRHYEDGLFFL